MISRQIVPPLTIAALGLIVAITAPERFHGFPVSLVGWIVSGFAMLAFVTILLMVLRQQNIDRIVSSNMLSSNRTRVFMGDGRDHFDSDRMVD